MSRDVLIEANKAKVNMESARIDSFLAQSGWTMMQTPTGLRYDIYHHGGGDSARNGMIAKVSMKSFLLDGSSVAATLPGETREIRIGKDDEVSGLHEALDMLARGDSARFILPSHLAYGLTGLNRKVPPNAAIFYDICLVGLR